MIRPLLSLLLIPTVTVVAAQTMFIPDTHLRDWLNVAKPGVVDADGYCDTVSWNAVPPEWVTFHFGNVPDGSSVDLSGIQYLKMDKLNIVDVSQSGVSVTWPGYPHVLSELGLERIDLDLFSPSILPLPGDLIKFTCEACGLDSIPAFQGTYLTFADQDLGGQVPVIPATLTSLQLQNCNISALPPLPDLNTLYLEDLSLSSLPPLPPDLLNFTATNIGIATIPPLPAGLGACIWTENGTTELPALPDLSILNVSDNAITTLTGLPDDLWVLRVDNNPITAISGLPDSIEMLYADSCPIMGIDAFPELLEYASLDAAQIGALPALPPNLWHMNLRNCELLDCLPVLPQALEELLLYNTAVSCLPNIPPGLDLTGGQYNLGIAAVFCDPGNSACPIVDPLVTGTVFNDANANGVQDGGESVRPFATVEAQPGSFLAGSNWDGRYVLPVDTGSFTVTGQPTLYEGTTTAPYAVSFASIGEVDSLNDIGYEVVPGIYDLVATLEAVPTRPGFETTVWVSVENVGTEATNAAVDFTFDGALEYVESSYMPQSQNGSLVEWNAGLLYPGASWTVEVTLYTPPGVAIGTPLVHAATVAPDQSDATPPDNLAVLNDTTVGSYDPNDKRVTPEVMTPSQVSSGAPLTWTVRFQNTGTFPAERVLITDTLSTDLRWNTMDIIASSHAHTWYILNGVLHVFFNGINLPDSASDETGSHGFIKFAMKPQGALPDGAQVANRANIFFDFNEPVITAPAIFTVDATSGLGEANNPALNIWPNPVEDALFIGGLSPEANTVLEVVDIHGAVLRTERHAPGTIRIGMHDLAAGAYALRVSSGGTITTRTFIKR